MARSARIGLGLVALHGALCLNVSCGGQQNPCEGVSCESGEACIVLESGPRCVCDDLSVEVTNEQGETRCVPADGVDAGPVDAG